MAACGSLQHIFENPLSTDNPKSQSTWNQIKPMEQSSFTEIFGELHFKENSNSSSSSSSSSSSPFHMSSFLDFNSQTGLKQLNKSTIFDKNCEGNSKTPSLESFSSTQKTQYSHQKSEIFSSMNHESLQLCTEGLGFESSDDVEDVINGHWEQKEERAMRTTEQSKTENLSGELKRSRTSKAAFPPPISCIGESGKPWVCFKSYREDGRFVLKEIRIPTPEILHACREDGRLKLQFVQPNSEITEEEEEEEDEENYDDEGNGFEEDDLKGDFQEEI